MDSLVGHPASNSYSGRCHWLQTHSQISSLSHAMTLTAGRLMISNGGVSPFRVEPVGCLAAQGLKDVVRLPLRQGLRDRVCAAGQSR